MIREISINDLDGLLLLYTQLHKNPLPVKSNELLRLYESIVMDKNYRVIIAEKDGTIVSSCTLIIIPNLTHSQRPYALIENVVTHQSFRGQGLASDCLDYAKKLATENNCYKIMLLTGAKDSDTLSFYKRAGYNKDDKTGFVQWL